MYGEISPTDCSRTTYMTCGKKDNVVPAPAKKPIVFVIVKRIVGFINIGSYLLVNILFSFHPIIIIIDQMRKQDIVRIPMKKGGRCGTELEIKLPFFLCIIPLPPFALTK